MAHLLRLSALALLGIVLTVLALLPLKAFAYPATSNLPPGTCTVAPCVVWFHINFTHVTGATAIAACQALPAAVNGPGDSPASYVSVTGNQCNLIRANGFTIQSPMSTTNVPPSTPTYTCPGGGTLSGASCVCPSGETDTGSACENPTAVLCTSLSGTETYATAPGNLAPGASSCNPTGCSITYAGTVIRVKNAQGVYVTEGAATFTGSTCQYSSQSGSAPDTCPGGTEGTVNGIVTCVAYDANLNTIESDKDESSSTTDSNGTTTTEKSTSTVCSAAGSCTSTTTTTTSVNGGAPTTTTETKEENRDDFCTSNPNSPQCKDSSFTGSCTGGFTCSGDAIQCAAARQIHELNCTLSKDSEQKTLFESERSNDTSPLTVNATSRAISSSDFSSSNSLGMSAGVADVPITVMGQSIVLPLSNLNQYLAQLRLVLLACAWFIAYRIVSGSVRE